MQAEIHTRHSAFRTQVGLIGWPVEHSLSPGMQNAAFAACGLDWTYTLWPASPETLAERIAGLHAAGIAGANVTVPHKTAVVPLLDAIHPDAAALGAVNTIVADAGRLIGYNTDGYGFQHALAAAGSAPGSMAVILGAGGAARAVAWALLTAGGRVQVLARRAEAAQALAAAFAAYGPICGRPLDAPTLTTALAGADLLVNATSAGMWPRLDDSPIPPGVVLAPRLLVYDLVYRPAPTRLLIQATAAGCRTLNGLSMLLHQGAAAFQLWTGLLAPLAAMRDALDAAVKATENEPL